MLAQRLLQNNTLSSLFFYVIKITSKLPLPLLTKTRAIKSKSHGTRKILKWNIPRITYNSENPFRVLFWGPPVS